MFTTGACTRETTRLCVFLLAFGAPCVRKRAEMEIPTCWNFQRVSGAYQRACQSLSLVGSKKLVLEGVVCAEYDSNCCFFCESLNARLGPHEPQAYRVHAPVVNTALQHHATYQCVWSVFKHFLIVFVLRF